ncbi:MAG: transposase [Candidatus Methylomirabilales bacterium]
MRQRKRFTREFKVEAVRLLEQGHRLASEIAGELGFRRNQLYKWQEQVAKQGKAAFPGSGRRGGPAEELARLQRELARVQGGRDILKKAAAYFAREAGKKWSARIFFLNVFHSHRMLLIGRNQL